MVFFKLLISAPHLEPLSPATKTIPAPPLLYLHPPTAPLSPLSPLSPSIHSPLLHSPSHIPPLTVLAPRKWVTPTGSGQSHTFRTPSITKLGDSRPLILSLSLCKNNIYLFKCQTLSFFFHSFRRPPAAFHPSLPPATTPPSHRASTHPADAPTPRPHAQHSRNGG